MTVNKILISQKEPTNTSPYVSLTEKYGVRIDFEPFYSIEPLSSREFRAQRINFLDFTAVVFSSRHAIDAYFMMADDLRIKIPETMKYFCTTEAVALYLQKHIIFRKRKIFYGNGTPQSVIDLIGTKHKGEKFLITTSDNSKPEAMTRLFDEKGLDYTTVVLVKSVSNDIKGLDPASYDMIVFYNPSDVESLYKNFPGFTQGDIRFISYGKSIVKAMEDAGLQIAVKAPSPEHRSVAGAIESYLKDNQ